MPKISVIMPSLNVVNYIEKAVRSVMNQTLKDLEIICVDAGSTDGTLEHIQLLAQEDDRIQIILSDKKSYGYQMNLGIKEARGEYIGIVETDDYVLPEMYDSLLRVASSNQLDLVKSDYVKFWWDDKITQYFKAVDNKELYNKVLTSSDRKTFYLFSSLNWTGIYKKEYLLKNAIWHSETLGASYQDIGFWLLNMSFANRAMWIDKAFYMYRQDNPMASMKNREKMFCSRDEYNRVLEILQRKGLKTEYLECLLLKELDYHVTFNRIEDSLKKQYLEDVAKYYAKEKKVLSEIDMKPFQKDNLVWVESAINNRSDLCRGIEYENRKIRGELENNSGLFIYGAGAVAEELFKEIFSQGYWDKIVNIITTSKAERDTFANKKIIEFDKAKEMLDEDSTIILAMGQKNREEIRQKLEQYGIKKILEPKDIEKLSFTIIK